MDLCFFAYRMQCRETVLITNDLKGFYLAEERRKAKKKVLDVVHGHEVEKEQLKVLYEQKIHDQQGKLAKFDQGVVRESLVGKDQANDAEKIKVRRNHQAAMRESRDKLQITEARLKVKNMLLEAEERKTAGLRGAIVAQSAKDIEIQQLRADNDNHVACIRRLQLALLSKVSTITGHVSLHPEDFPRLGMSPRAPSVGYEQLY